MIKFFWNGLKVNGGKLERAWFGTGPWVNSPADMITIYAKDYRGFSREVAETFEIENNTDSQTDYFEKDRIRVFSTHPLYEQVKEAAAKYNTHYERKG